MLDQDSPSGVNTWKGLGEPFRQAIMVSCCSAEFYGTPPSCSKGSVFLVKMFPLITAFISCALFTAFSTWSSSAFNTACSSHSTLFTTSTKLKSVFVSGWIDANWDICATQVPLIVKFNAEEHNKTCFLLDENKWSIIVFLLCFCRCPFPFHKSAAAL